MTKTTTILAFSIVLALVIGIVSSGPIVEAAKPVTETIVLNDNTNPIPVTGIPSNVVCPAGNTKIITTYTIGGTNIEVQHATKPNLINDRQVVATIHDVDDLYQPHAIDVANRLNELGYFVDDGSVRPVNSDDVASISLLETNPFCMES